MPARWAPLPEDLTGPTSGAAPEPDAMLTDVTRDGQIWRLGTAEDVAWITGNTPPGTSITSAVPPVFDGYATVTLPEDTDDQAEHDAALLSVLRAHTGDRRWWLGYLDNGADDVVFPAAPGVELYSHWRYIVVLAGPDEAAGWRRGDLCSFWSGHLPNLMFPIDRRWIVSTMWDDDWTCVGGPVALIDALLSHCALAHRVRRVELGQVATPPGHTAI